VEFSLRDFAKTDFETLWRIDQQCFAPGISYSQPELAAYIRLLGSFTLVAENPDSRDVLGFLVATAARHSGHIITIDVLPEARCLGVGSRLLSTAEDRLRKAQCSKARLETAVNNHAALRFYKRHSYFVVKTIPRYYADGVDAIVLEKHLFSPPADK